MLKRKIFRFCYIVKWNSVMLIHLLLQMEKLICQCKWNQRENSKYSHRLCNIDHDLFQHKKRGLEGGRNAIVACCFTFWYAHSGERRDNLDATNDSLLTSGNIKKPLIHSWVTVFPNTMPAKQHVNLKGSPTMAQHDFVLKRVVTTAIRKCVNVESVKVIALLFAKSNMQRV